MEPIHILLLYLGGAFGTFVVTFVHGCTQAQERQTWPHLDAFEVIAMSWLRAVFWPLVLPYLLLASIVERNIAKGIKRGAP